MIVISLRISMFSMFSVVPTLFYLWLWIQIRSTFPRHRYDFLMNIAWKRFLPVSLILIVFNSVILIIYK
jgi:NADH:ubiquinone oxidoreductase subunit H